MSATGKGKRYPSEKSEYSDLSTDAAVSQITNALASPLPQGRDPRRSVAELLGASASVLQSGRKDGHIQLVQERQIHAVVHRARDRMTEERRYQCQSTTNPV